VRACHCQYGAFAGNQRRRLHLAPSDGPDALGHALLRPYRGLHGHVNDRSLLAPLPCAPVAAIMTRASVRACPASCQGQLHACMQRQMLNLGSTPCHCFIFINTANHQPRLLRILRIRILYLLPQHRSIRGFSIGQCSRSERPSNVELVSERSSGEPTSPGRRPRSDVAYSAIPRVVTACAPSRFSQHPICNTSIYF
jgi:hypothetical protein